jgi:hypothetical protein
MRLMDIKINKMEIIMMEKVLKAMKMELKRKIILILNKIL